MWLTDATPVQKRTLLAASLGWMLDSMDVLPYSMVLAYMMRDLGMREGTAGLMASLTLAASAVGGVAFGIFADRFGRSRALTVSILVYSLFTAACGLSSAFLLTSGAFLFAGFVALKLPETLGRELR